MQRLTHALRHAYAQHGPRHSVADEPRLLGRLLTALALGTWCVLLIFFAERLTYGAENLRTLEVVSLGRDQGYVAGVLWDMWQHGPFAASSVYGDLYFLLGWFGLRVLSLFGSPSQESAIVVLRTLSLGSYAAFGALTYVGARRLGGASSGAVALLLAASLCASGDFALRVTACQPDMLNLAVGAAALILAMEAFRSPSVLRTIATGAAIGAVMAVKLSAVFVALLAAALLLAASLLIGRASQIDLLERSVRAATALVSALLALSVLMVGAAIVFKGTRYAIGPQLPLMPTWPRITVIAYPIVLALVLACLLLAARLASSGRTALCCAALALSQLVLLVGTAAASFAMLSPDAIMGLRFLVGLTARGGALGYGSGPAGWILLVSRSPLLWPLLISLAYGIWLTWDRARGRSLPWNRDVLLVAALIAWEALMLLVVFVLVPKPEERFLYPFAAAILVTAGIGVAGLAAAGSRRLGSVRLKNALMAGAVFAAALVPAALAAQPLLGQRDSDFRPLAELPGYQVGDWLSDRYPAGTVVLQYGYAYVPERYKSVFEPYGDPRLTLRKYAPGILIVDMRRVESIRALPPDGRDSGLEVRASIVQQYYENLLGGRLGYSPVAQFPTEPEEARFIVMARRDLESR